MTTYTDAEAAAKIIRECDGVDPEKDHAVADDLLILLLRELGYNQTADAFEEIEKWYA